MGVFMKTNLELYKVFYYAKGTDYYADSEMRSLNVTIKKRKVVSRVMLPLEFLWHILPCSSDSW